MEVINNKESIVEIIEYNDKIIPILKEEIHQEALKYLNIYMLDKNHQKIEMMGYVGVLKLTNKVTLYSYSKVSIENILRMYNYITKKIEWKDDKIFLNKSINILNTLSYIFISEVEDIVRNSFRRFYKNINENMMILKGRILFYDTIQKNRFTPYLFCEYFEFTDDILDNQILKYAIFLQMKAYSGDIKQIELFNKLRYLYSFFNNITLRHITLDDINKVFYDRLNKNYEKAHYISKFFIEYLYVQHGIGEKKFFSFMINMNDIFEEFIRSIIRRYNHNYKVINGNYTEKTLDYIDKKIIKIKPDIILEKEGQTKIIIDCKYKKIKKIEDDQHIDMSKPFPSDVYQLLSYLITYKCKKGIIIYPKGEAEDVELNIQVETEIYKIKIKQIDLTNLDEIEMKNFVYNIDN